MTNTQNDLNVGNAIRSEREKNNLTQEQLAELVGVSTRTVGKWENGKSLPTKHMNEIVSILKISQREILAGIPKNDSGMEDVSEIILSTEERTHNDITRMVYCFDCGVGIVGVALLVYLSITTDTLLREFIFTLYCFCVICVVAVWMTCFLICETKTKRRCKEND